MNVLKVVFTLFGRLMAYPSQKIGQGPVPVLKAFRSQARTGTTETVSGRGIYLQSGKTRHLESGEFLKSRFTLLM